MNTGKLPYNLLQALLSKVPEAPDVLVGPGIGIDAAVVRMGDRLLVTKTDPITFAADEIGWYAVHVNANDVASMGAEPRWFMASILLPTSASEADVQAVFDQILAACDEVGAVLVGGHTEITHDLDRPIVVGCMMGEASRASLVTAAGAREGDDVLITKGVAVEGTAIIAREGRERLVRMGFTPEFIARAADFLHDPGISVVRDARIAREAADVHAMHDPTEGGLATGLMELAEASGLGVDVDWASIPFLPETLTLCRELGLDPLGLIASGSLLVTCDPADTPRLLAACYQAGVTANVIGRMTPRSHGLMLQTPHGPKPLPTFPRDEIARFFED